MYWIMFRCMDHQLYRRGYCYVESPFKVANFLESVWVQLDQVILGIYVMESSTVGTLYGVFSLLSTTLFVIAQFILTRCISCRVGKPMMAGLLGVSNIKFCFTVVIMVPTWDIYGPILWDFCSIVGAKNSALLLHGTIPWKFLTVQSF